MVYNLFEYTRDKNYDYDWKVKPDYLPGHFSRLATFLFEIRDLMRDDTSIEWDKVVLFLKNGNASIACQVLEAGSDRDGRTIYTMRGVSAYNQLIRAIMNIPDLITYVHANGLPTVMSEKYAGMILDNDRVEIDDVINPLIPNDMNLIPNELNNSGFLKVIEDIRREVFEYNVVIGPGAEMVCKQINSLLNHRKRKIELDSFGFYDLNLNYEISPYEVMPIDSICNHSSFSSDNKAVLCLKLYRSGEKNGAYEWILVRRSDRLTIKSVKHQFVEKLQINSLLDEAQKIGSYFSMIGFDIT